MEVSDGLLHLRVDFRTYDLHRPEGCTVLALTRDGWEGNEFGFWLPENVGSWQNWERGPCRQQWRQVSARELAWTEALPEAEVTCTATLDGGNDCLWYRIAVTNTSPSDLHRVRHQTCLHFVNAPEFISIHGERLWACLDGAWRTTDTVPRHKSMDPRRVGFFKAKVRPERTVQQQPAFPSAMLEEEAHHPLFLTESFDRRKSVGLAARDFHSLFNNNDPILRCLHSQPNYFAEIPVGETRQVEGVILFCDGDHDALLARYEAVIPEEWKIQ